jgi:hypothetical protein
MHFERIHIVEEQDLDIAGLKMDIHTHILPQPSTGLRRVRSTEKDQLEKI